ncbi:aldo/keto reductase [Actinomadura sp. WMMB 499]|uniref:aldo/keto reductase n=1 Tax=Actinomadura sp. WMMB 499 TaxID=1219491 RepID=UPI0012485E5E|nr:aldo/keto reductase [Actinomadura sp. WMMB 499]QFG26220.1 TetR family transcriptional regulator [Actinomadura sp. WMMB 499]
MSSDRSRPGRPTSTQAARLTERLRRAAVDTFLQNGYDGTTMEAVARAAGVTKGTLYGRYPDKRTLFLAVSSWALTRQERDERVVEPLPDDLAAALTVIARAILARAVDPDIVRMSRMAIAESERFPEFAAGARAVTWTPRMRVIMDLLRRHRDAGSLVVGDIEIAAEQFFAMVGSMPAWLAAYGTYRTPEVEEAHVRHAVHLFLHGVLVREESPEPPGEERADPPREPGPRRAGPVRRTAPIGDERRRLGSAGLHLSPLGLGTAAFGGRDCDERSATALVHRYLDAGGAFVHTAGPVAEEICGRALGDGRGRVVLAAGAGTPTGHGARGGANGRAHLRAACEASLRRLRTDHIDLYLLDADDPVTPLEETVDALDDLVRAGKVLYIGVSNFRAYRVMKALSISDRRSRTRFAAVRGRYDPSARHLERELFPLLAEEGLGFIGDGPRAAGAPPADGAPALASGAERLGCTPDQLMLAAQLAGPVASVISDAATVAGLEEHLAATRIRIPADLAAGLGGDSLGKASP